MSDQTSQAQARRQRLDEAIGSFLVALDAGRKPDHREWLARHPDLCPELANFFADRACVDDLIEPMRAASEPVHGGRAAAGLLATTWGEGITTDRPALPGVDGETTSDDDRSEQFPRGTRVRYFGDYELRRVLGEGGMGIVYEARELSLDRPVALKMIKAARFASADDVRRFRNEAESVARLDHPHIVPILEVGQFEDQHYFSMKLIAGEGLDRRLGDFSGDPRRTARLMELVAGAIQHAHQRGILHRDLKPANILVDAEGRPHVTDFGLAKRIDGDNELTQTGAVLGTPAYMAPEQTSAKKGAVTTATDVYGLGAIFYALLTGRGPFGGTTVLETLDQVRQQPPEPPHSLNPRVPRDLEVICLKCLEKDPRQRYASADAMAEDLNCWLAGEPIAARPVCNAARLWMWCRRNPALAGAAGLLMAALVAVALLSLLSANRQARLAAAETLRADEQTRHADDQARAAAKLKSALAESNRRLAILNFERGQFAYERGEIGPGLLWMGETARVASESGDANWKRVALANLSSWRTLYPNLRMVLADGSNLTGLISVSLGGRVFTPGDRGTAATFSPDGKTILTVEGTTARLWDTSSGQPIGEPLPHVYGIAAIAFSPDSKMVLTGAVDRNARLWNTRTGRLIGKTLEHQANVLAVAFSPDGKTVVTGSGYSTGTARLWDTASGQPIGEPFQHQRAVLAVAFSPDGKSILTGDEAGMARLWDTTAGRPIGTELKHGDEVRRVTFSPNGRIFLTGSRTELRLWNADTAQPIGQRMMGLARGTCFAFSPDSRFLLTASGQKTVQLWDARTGEPLGKPLHLEHPGSVRAVAISPDAKLILTGGDDKRARLWDAVTGRPLGQAMEHQDAVVSLAFSPDGTIILTGSDDKAIRLWDVEIGQPIPAPLKRQHRATDEVAADSAVVVAERNGKTVRLRNAATRQEIGKPLHDTAEITAVVVSGDGKTVLTGNRGGTARLWDVATGQPLSRPLPGASPVAFSADGKTVVVDSGGARRLWHVPTSLPDDPALLSAWVQTLTGLELDDQGAVRVLDGTEWRRRRELLNQLGGPPAADSTPMLDPILFGQDPTARAEGWIARRCWPEVEAAFDEALQAGPFDAQSWDRRGWFYHQRGDTEKAAVAFARALALSKGGYGADGITSNEALFVRTMAELKRNASAPDAAAAEIPMRLERGKRFKRWKDLHLAAAEYRIALDRGWTPNVEKDGVSHYQVATAFLAVGDLNSYSLLCSRLLASIEQLRGWTWGQNNNLVCIYAVGPDALADMSTPVRLAEATLKSLNTEESESEAALLKTLGAEEASTFKKRTEPRRRASRAAVLGTLGAALFRAGRFEEAIRRLEEGIRLRKGESDREDWAFLAMAHYRLGHNDEARHWVDRFRNDHPNLGDETNEYILANLLLRSEAEAMVLHDPVFPADPFEP